MSNIQRTPIYSDGGQLIGFRDASAEVDTAPAGSVEARLDALEAAGGGAPDTIENATADASAYVDADGDIHIFPKYGQQLFIHRHGGSGGQGSPATQYALNIGANGDVTMKRFTGDTDAMTFVLNGSGLLLQNPVGTIFSVSASGLFFTPNPEGGPTFGFGPNGELRLNNSYGTTGQQAESRGTGAAAVFDAA